MPFELPVLVIAQERNIFNFQCSKDAAKRK
jgi:hypothetical protein